MKTDSAQTYSFTLDRLEIEARNCQVKEIPVEGLELWSKTAKVSSPKFLSFTRFQGEKTTLRSSKSLTQYSLIVQTEEALTELVKRLSSIQTAKQRCIEIPLSFLKIQAYVRTDQLTSLLFFFPELKELTLMTNCYITLYPILSRKALQKLTIEDGLIYLDPGEKNLIIRDFPKIDLKIVLNRTNYHFHSPSSSSIAAYTSLLVLIFGIGIHMLDAIEKEISQNSPGIDQPKIPPSKIWFPLMLLIGSTIAYLRLMTSFFEMVEGHNREVVRAEPNTIEQHVQE